LLIREAIDKANLAVGVHTVDDGEKALRYLQQIDSDESAIRPSLIILDINLPKMTGDEVLRRMRQMRRCAGLRVIVVTSSDSDEDRDRMAKLGVNEYFRKPSDYDEFMKLAGILTILLSPTNDE
jgi:DNA-binding response OmpR family regulator